MLIIGISLKLLAVKDVSVGNYLPALVIAPALVGLRQPVPLIDDIVGTSRRKPGVRTSCIGCSGEVRST